MRHRHDFKITSTTPLKTKRYYFRDRELLQVFSMDGEPTGQVSFSTKSLGKGGYGIVYKGHILQSKEDGVPETEPSSVVVKEFLNSKQRSNKRMLAKVQKEGRLFQDFYPKCTCHYCFKERPSEKSNTNKVYYLVMPFIPSETLKSYINRITRDQISTLDRVRVAVEVMRAVWRLHNKRILHNDLKPENLLIQDDGSIAIIDFGASEKLILGARVAVGHVTPIYARNRLGEQRRVSLTDEAVIAGLLNAERCALDAILLPLLGVRNALTQRGKKNLKADATHQEKFSLIANIPLDVRGLLSGFPDTGESLNLFYRNLNELVNVNRKAPGSSGEGLDESVFMALEKYYGAHIAYDLIESLETLSSTNDKREIKALKQYMFILLDKLYTNSNSDRLQEAEQYFSNHRARYFPRFRLLRDREVDYFKEKLKRHFIRVRGAKKINAVLQGDNDLAKLKRYIECIEEKNPHEETVFFKIARGLYPEAEYWKSKDRLINALKQRYLQRLNNVLLSKGCTRNIEPFESNSSNEFFAEMLAKLQRRYKRRSLSMLAYLELTAALMKVVDGASVSDSERVALVKPIINKFSASRLKGLADCISYFDLCMSIPASETEQKKMVDHDPGLVDFLTIIKKLGDRVSLERLRGALDLLKRKYPQLRGNTTSRPDIEDCLPNTVWGSARASQSSNLTAVSSTGSFSIGLSTLPEVDSVRSAATTTTVSRITLI